jgi:2-hydroxy-3-oxopropionate reductase
MATLGFVGLGIMGRPMVARLLAAGHAVHVWNRSGVRPETVERGAKPCRSAAEVARQADIVWINVSDTGAVEQVLFGPGGVGSGLSAGKLVIDHSTIAPEGAKAFAERLARTGVDFLDAPVSGGEVGAREGTLAIMVGGKAEAFERAKPFLEVLGRNVTHVGPSGAGQVCKAANQIIVALTMQAVAEGLLFASKAGADPARVRQALMGGFASSRILELHGRRMIERDFEPGGRIRFQVKDNQFVLDGARALGVSLPCSATTQQLFTACVAMGGGDWDHSAVVRPLEAISAHEIGRGR